MSDMPAEDTPLLRVRGLSMSFGARASVRDVDFELWPG